MFISVKIRLQAAYEKGAGGALPDLYHGKKNERQPYKDCYHAVRYPNT